MSNKKRKKSKSSNTKKINTQKNTPASKKSTTNNEQTKTVKKVQGKDNVNLNKDNKKKDKKEVKHSKLKKVIRIFFILIIILAIIAIGTIAGIVFGVIGNDLEITEENLAIKTSNSVVLDIEGNQIAQLNGDENREIISLSEMGEYLSKAFVSIEDERFYSHNGVDLPRTISATMNYLVKAGDTSYGGSTITQQLIKNATGDKEQDWTRKVKEIVRAYKIEKVMSKSQILESYLNTIPLGGGAKNVHGVKTASRYYFDKNPTELTVAQAAYIAGITHSPNLYGPFKETPNIEKINSRTKTVLLKMKELGNLEEEQYNEAVAEVEEGLAFKEGNIIQKNSLSYHSEAAINQILDQMVEEKGLDRKAAEARLYGGGYKIYTTQNTTIQNRVNEEYLKTKYIVKGRKKNEDGTLKNETTQSGMVIMDHKTGQVLAVGGTLGEKTAFGKNYGTAKVAQPGSAIKPLATIAPGLETNAITAATVLDDSPKSYGRYTPRNSYAGYKGLMNIKKMIEISSNVPEVKLLQKITPKKSIEFMQSMGLNMQDQPEELALVLGGTKNYVSPLEMATAYSVIANGGEYISPTFYTKIEDSNGEVILEPKQEKRRIMSEQNAYIEKMILKGPVEGAAGTARGVKVSGMDVGAKTGSTDEYTDRWLCGFTPYYTAATWIGYPNYKERPPFSNNMASTIWAAIMKDIHKGLESKTFEKPSGIVTGAVCRDSGLKPTELCSQDPRGARAYTETFVKGTVPTGECDVHVKVKICKETGKVANEFCRDTEEKVFITRKDSEQDTSWKSAEDAKYMAPIETCDVHTKLVDTEKPVITLKGEVVVKLKLNQKYTELGATAHDNIDGDITNKIKIEGNVDTKKIGTYKIKYIVSDEAGNTDIKERTVIVEKDSTNNTVTNQVNNTITNQINNIVTNTTRH